MAHYVKVFGSLIHSTLWQEEPPIKVVWVTMLALADAQGEVQASIPGLAKAAGVSILQCEEALAKFLSPDPYSRSKEAEGRRIEVIDGGWELINYIKYRKLKSSEQELEGNAIRQARYRERERAKKQSVTAVTGNNTESPHIDETNLDETNQKQSSPSAAASSATPPRDEKRPPRKKGKQADLITGLNPLVKEAVVSLRESWPNTREGAKFYNSTGEAGVKIQTILADHPEVTLEDLMASARRYLSTNPEYPNAIQNYFGRPKPGEKISPWQRDLIIYFTEKESNV